MYIRLTKKKYFFFNQPLAQKLPVHAKRTLLNFY